MKVHVKLYGPFSLMSGKNEFAIEAEKESINLEEFLSLLEARLPRLRRSMEDTDIEEFLKRRILLVVNDMPSYDKSTLISDGDQVKVLTPIAGG